MTENTKVINPGGINGSGKGVVNSNSKDFQGLREIVKKNAANQTARERIKYKLISLKFQMEAYISHENPRTLRTVGEFLKQHIIALNIKNKDFAKYIELEESNLSAIIRGKRKINIDLALKLGQIFNLDPNIWLLIQSRNEIIKTKIKRNKEYQKYHLDDLLKKIG